LSLTIGQLTQQHTEEAMNRITITCGALLLLAAFSMMLPSEVSAQKKKAPAKTEQATDQPAPMPQKMGGTMKDVLAKYKGEKTNLGVLTRIEGDYFVVEEDGVSTIHPLSAIIGIKMLKAEEGDEDPVKIDITLTR
jgi:hypothetical protein